MLSRRMARARSTLALLVETAMAHRDDPPAMFIIVGATLPAHNRSVKPSLPMIGEDGCSLTLATLKGRPSV
ncbi:MAG: hypothetical protein ACYCO4_04910 [Sulfobacillus sp.]